MVRLPPARVEHVRQSGLMSAPGAVPIKGGADAETNALPFCVESEITKEERGRERMRMMKEMQTAFF
jgi:hypothetical protein